MAYSSSVIRAQVIKLCELCNEDKIKWRCIDCERCLCEKCKTIHLKVPVTAKHQIVTIGTPIEDVQRKVITDNIPCKNHARRMTCMFCKTCHCLVCSECVSSSHTKHQFMTIEKALDWKIEDLKCTQAIFNESLKTCNSKSTEFQHYKPKYNSVFDESVTKIKQQEQDLKKAISKYSKVLQDRVEVERLNVKTIITQAEQQIDRIRKKLDNLKQELETALSSNQGQFIFETTWTQPVLKFNPLPHKVENFFPEDKATLPLQEIFGTFLEVTIPTVQLDLVLEELRTFTTDLPAIDQVVPLNETSAWIACGKSTKPSIKKVTIQDKNMVTSKEIHMVIHDMALTSDNDILLTESNKSDVKLMTKSGEIKSFLSVAPMIPKAIHVTIDNKVLIGVEETGAKSTLKDLRRAVMVYGMDGQQKKRYQYGRNRKRLYSYPYRITTNNNKDILVIDWTYEQTRRVVTFDREGNLSWVYDGHSKINSTTQFFPTDLVTTAAGHIIVSDALTHALHVLSECGYVLTCKVMADVGISYPLGVNIDKRGKLCGWVVVKLKKTQVQNYTLSKC